MNKFSPFPRRRARTHCNQGIDGEEKPSRLRGVGRLFFFGFGILAAALVFPGAARGEGESSVLPSAEESQRAAVLYQGALLDYEAGNLASAGEAYQRLVSEHPRTAAGRKAQLRLILVYLREGEYVEAAKQSLRWFVNFFLHLDRHLNDIVADFKTWTYLLLFLIIFCETGLVVTPILPGDSLLFAAGALSATPGSPLRVELLFLLLAAAGILGDTVNYWIGHQVGPRVFRQEKSRWFKKEYLERTHAFYERHGGKTIIIARFMPIIRTFAPFVAGIGAMTYWRFLTYNVIGASAWIAIFIFGGYKFGEVPLVKNNFSLVIIAIVIISVMPGVIEYLRAKYGKERKAAERGKEATS